MLFKTTKKAVKGSYNTILSIGYCNAQHLLNYESEFAYSAGVNGWACDYYDIDNVCISTGYSPIGKSVDYAILARYEAQAQAIQYDNGIAWEEEKKRVHILLLQFIKEVTNNGN